MVDRVSDALSRTPGETKIPDRARRCIAG